MPSSLGSNILARLCSPLLSYLTCFCTSASPVFQLASGLLFFLGQCHILRFMICFPDSDIVQILSLFLSVLKPARQNCHTSGLLICVDVWGRVWQLHPAGSPSFKDDRSLLSMWSTSWQLPVSPMRTQPTYDWTNIYFICEWHKQFGQETKNGQEPYVIPIWLIHISEMK